MKIQICAVAALAATALLFPAPSHAYCRGCVIEKPKPALLASADASALPVIKPACHIERQVHWKNGRKRVRRVEVCE